MSLGKIAVVGAGAMGAAAAWQLARRGYDVVIFEQFDRLHDRGSSHGSSRVFRLAYPTAPWVRFACEALKLWHQLEDEAGVLLLDQFGSLDHGTHSCTQAIAGTLSAAGIAHEVLDAEAAQERFPGMRVDGQAVFHPQGGGVNATATVEALLTVAGREGAEIREREPVERLDLKSDSAIVHTETGAWEVDRVVVTAGSWVQKLLGNSVDLGSTVVTQEQPVTFQPTLSAEWPAFIHYAPGPAKTNGLRDPVSHYGLATPEGGIKIGEHHTGIIVDPDERPDGADPIRLARLQAHVQEWFPGLDSSSAAVETCLYTTTPTTDFILRSHGPVVVGAGFSGHGFKFVPRVGAALADLVEGKPAPQFR